MGRGVVEDNEIVSGGGDVSTRTVGRKFKYSQSLPVHQTDPLGGQKQMLMNE